METQARKPFMALFTRQTLEGRTALCWRSGSPQGVDGGDRSPGARHHSSPSHQRPSLGQGACVTGAVRGGKKRTPLRCHAFERTPMHNAATSVADDRQITHTPAPPGIPSALGTEVPCERLCIYVFVDFDGMHQSGFQNICKRRTCTRTHTRVKMFA